MVEYLSAMPTVDAAFSASHELIEISLIQSHTESRRLQVLLEYGVSLVTGALCSAETCENETKSRAKWAGSGTQKEEPWAV